VSEEFKPSGIESADFECVSSSILSELGVIGVGSMSTLKDFQETHQHVFFTPAIPYGWFAELELQFDVLFSDLPDRYRKHIKRLSILPAPIIDGFYGDQSFWNYTLWTIPAELWIPFCKQIAGKGYFDTKEKMVVLFSMGVCNAVDVIAKLKGKQAGQITVAYIGVHTNNFSYQMSETLDSAMLSVARMPPDPHLKAFAEKLWREDSAAADDLVLKPRPKFVAPEVEICTPSQLSRAQNRRFRELSSFYRQVFDDRGSPQEETDA